jgi:hypothetical protein
MALDPITAVSSLVETVVNRIWPDATERDKARLAVEQMRMSGELQQVVAEFGLLQGQIETNKAEAGHSSVFVAGWRPYIGWVSGIGLTWEFIVRPAATWGLAHAGAPIVDLPAMHAAELFPLVFAMLGVSASRTIEKVKGVAR